ncbi:MAG: hypothetical protein ACLQOQ_09235 [Beijerinckiaceae bacterium]
MQRNAIRAKPQQRKRLDAFRFTPSKHCAFPWENRPFVSGLGAIVVPGRIQSLISPNRRTCLSGRPPIGDFVMPKRIDKFGEALRLKLTNIETGLSSLKSTIDAKAQHAEKDVRDHLGAVNKRIEQERAKVTAAQAEVKTWVDEQKAATSEKIAEWKTKRETAKLQHRAESTEHYAEATIVLAAAALDEAEHAVLQAWAARLDAAAHAK